MRRIAILLGMTFTIFSSDLFGQGVKFSQIYYSLLEFKSFSLTETPDGGYLLAGGMSLNNGADFRIVKTDSLGNIQWIKSGNRFDGINYDNTMFSVTYLDNYYYLIGIIITNTGSFHFKAYFAKCDTAGNLIWDRIDSSLSSFGTRIVKSRDNNLLFTGYTANTTTGILNNSWFGKIDTAGNLLWSTVIPDSTLIEATDIEEINEKFIVSARSFVDTGSANLYGSHIYCMDSLGNSYWNFSETDTSNNGITELVLDSGFLYAAQYYDLNFYNQSAYNSSILKFDTLGNFKWQNALSNLQFKGRGRNVNLIKTNDNNLMAVCKGLNHVKINKDGNDIWMLEPDTIGYDVLQTILNSKGHYVSTGHFAISGLIDISFLTSAFDTSITSIEEINNKIAVDIFPNPFTSYINLFLNIDNCFLNIYSVTGNILFQSNIKRGFNNINLSHLSNGIYFLQINFSGKKYVNKIIKLTN